MDFLNSVTPDNQDEFILQMRRFNLGPVGEADCPVFDGMFDYCAVSSFCHPPCFWVSCRDGDSRAPWPCSMRTSVYLAAGSCARVLAGLQVYSGGSVGGAMLMNEHKADICLNWAGELLIPSFCFCCLLWSLWLSKVTVPSQKMPCKD